MSFDDTSAKFGLNDLAAVRTDIAVQTIFCNNQRVITKFNKLVNTHLVQFFASTPTSAITSTSRQLQCLINLVAGKRLPIHTGMIRLTTLAMTFLRSVVLGRLDNVRGRRFGGVERVLGQLLATCSTSLTFCSRSSATCFSNVAIRVSRRANCASSLAIRHL